VKNKPGKKKSESVNAAIPPWFDLPKTFYRNLAAYAEEFGLTTAEFLNRSIRHYAKALREKESPATKALGSAEFTERFKQMSAESAKAWWSKITPEEKSARAKKAIESRWAKKRGQGKSPADKPE
jgi:hypothetical protein